MNKVLQPDHGIKPLLSWHPKLPFERILILGLKTYKRLLVLLRQLLFDKIQSQILLQIRECFLVLAMHFQNANEFR